MEKLGEYDPKPRTPAYPKTFHPELDSYTMRMMFNNGPGEEFKPEKKIVWNVERIRWWLANGAVPTESVVKLLERVSFVV